MVQPGFQMRKLIVRMVGDTFRGVFVAIRQQLVL